MKEEDRNPKAVLRIVKPTLLIAVGKRRSMRGILKEVVKLPPVPVEKDKEVVVDVMFWSGGKDSYLSLLLLEQSYLSELREGKIVLMTTFVGSTGEILHQCLTCRDVMNQAKAMGYDLLLVPLPDQGGKGVSNISYQDTVNNALKVLREEISTEVLKFDTSSKIRMRLIFGDLHVQEIRDWRESTFGGKDGLECIFPAFKVEYSVLQKILWTATGTGPKAEVESIQLSVWTGSRDDESTWNLFAKGQTYDQNFVSSLPPAIDTMGENGEFHSHVLLKQKKGIVA